MKTEYFNGKRFIQLYDAMGMELLGSDSVWIFDQRLSDRAALGEMYKKIQAQAAAYAREPGRYVKPRACYAAVLNNDALAVGYPATLENPLYPETW